MLTVAYLKTDILHQLGGDLALKHRPWPESSSKAEGVLTLVLLLTFRTGAFGCCIVPFTSRQPDTKGLTALQVK